MNTPDNAGKNKARPQLMPGMAPGLYAIAGIVKATDSDDLIKAAQYCQKLAAYLESDRYKAQAQARRIAAVKSKVKRGVMAKKSKIYDSKTGTIKPIKD